MGSREVTCTGVASAEPRVEFCSVKLKNLIKSRRRRFVVVRGIALAKQIEKNGLYYI